MQIPINNKSEFKKYGKALPNIAITAESFLWNFLKDSQLGYKFRRQHSVNYYILDLYCPLVKLTIKIDG